jgi:nucleoside-diphosphate-sugar epimerase
MTTDRVVLVTGATGFIGGHLLPSLSGKPVRVALRSAGRNAGARADRIYVGEVNGRTEWADALAGVRCVVHMAAHVHAMKQTADDRQSFHEVNTLGTERLALAAAAAGVRRFIFVSSIKVNGESTTDRPFRAIDVPHPVDAYGISKWEAEQRLFRVAADANMEAVVVRPTLVYGPGVGGNFLKLLSWVYNLCGLIARMVEIPAINSGVFLVSDGVELSTPELIRRVAAAMSRSARLVPVPATLLKAAGTLTGTGPSIDRLCDSLTVDITPTCHSFDWRPSVSTDEALIRTARWYIEHRA